MSVQKVDIGALNREVFGTIGRPFIDAFNIDDGGGIDCDLKVFGDEGDNSFFWYDHSEDKAFLQRTTEDDSPGRLLYIQHLGSAMKAGQNIQGLQIRARATGTGAIAGGCDGAEIKAGLNSDSDTGTIAGARGVIANIDAKKGTITTAHGVEMQVDIGAGGTITTLKGFRASLNNSGTLTDSYAFIVETANVSYPWEYGLFMASGQATYPIKIANAPTGASAVNQIELDIDETMAHSTGYARGIYVNWTHVSGDVTGTAEINPLSVDMGITAGDVSNAFAVSLYTGGMGTGTIGHLSGLYLYSDDIGGGATVNYRSGIDLNIDNGDNATVASFIRMYNHGGASNTMDYVFDFANNGHGAADYLLHVGATGGFLVVDAGVTGDNSTHKIAVLVGPSTVRYIALFDY